MKATKSNHDTLVKKWRALAADGNTNAYDRAIFMCEARKILPNGEFGLFLSKDLYMHGGEIVMYTRMAEAAVVVNDKKVWQALGWRGVSLLRTLKTKRLIASVVRECMKQAVDGVVLDTSIVSRAIYARTGTSQTNSAKNAGGSSASASIATVRSVKTSTKVSATASSGACTCGLASLARELNELINNGYGFIADALSAKALAALKNCVGSHGAKPAKRKRATA